jgi:hypothetical protein
LNANHLFDQIYVEASSSSPFFSLPSVDTFATYFETYVLLFLLQAAKKGGLQSIRKVPSVTTYSPSFAAKKEPKAGSAGSAPPLLSK